MPVNLTEAINVGDGHYLVSEAGGYRSRDVGTIASGSGVVAAGTVLGRVTASGRWAPWNPAAEDGSQNAGAILYSGCDATAAAVKRTLTVRDSEVQAAVLHWPSGATAPQRAAALAALAELGIIAR